MGQAALEQRDHYDVLDGLRNGDGKKAREAIQPGDRRELKRDIAFEFTHRFKFFLKLF